MKRVALSVLFDFAARAAGALVLALPVTAAVAATGIGNFPAGDRLLFERGGLLLVEVARASWSLLPPLATSSLVTCACVCAALALPQAVLWTALAEETPEPRGTFLGRACARVPAYLALSGLGFLGQVLVLTLGLTAAGMFHGRSSENAMHGDFAALAVLAGAFVVALLLGLLRDVAGATLACGVDGSRNALRAGLLAVWKRPAALLGRWLWAAALAAALVGSAAVATGALDVGRPDARRFVLVTLLHQLVALGLTVCRALWFRGAIGLVRPQVAGGSMARR